VLGELASAPKGDWLALQQPALRVDSQSALNGRAERAAWLSQAIFARTFGAGRNGENVRLPLPCPGSQW